MPEPRGPVTEADVQSLREKLREFSLTLSPGEQIVLGLLLERAAGSGEVQGYFSQMAVGPAGPQAGTGVLFADAATWLGGLSYRAPGGVSYRAPQ